MTCALIPFLLMLNFAPAPQVSGVAIYLLAGLTLASIATVEYLATTAANGKYRPGFIRRRR